ncbi:MAG: protein-L-isoaspartate(D-aspartate) O-methyltransferase [Bacteroidia bacterium]|nr:protein-L-isoaspartate(D-aspartate) O-methyltransferase [Bacteroidia bacterium]
MKDTYRHKGLRKNLVNTLSSKGIQNQKVLDAIASIPRHFFFDKEFEDWAYEDKAFPIGCDQTISQPFTVAYQTQLLNVEKRDKVLEIGTGSGYQAAILAYMGARVFSIERQKVLFDRTKAFLGKNDFGNIRMFYKDGFEGLPEFAPFDHILLTAGATKFPDTLGSQLRIGGNMVIPIGKHIQTMYRYTRVSEVDFDEEIFAEFRFVPMLPGVNP